jgi:hypothetical protein
MLGGSSGGWEAGGGGGEFSYSFNDDPQEPQQFESFSYGNGNQAGRGSGSGFYDPSTPAGAYSSAQTQGAPTYFVPQTQIPPSGGGDTGFESTYEDEPPLLEELGINPYQIIEKTLSVLNPFRHTDASILQDTDLAGPVVFCVLFGFILLLSGKVHFGYIYGIGVIGCVGMFFLLNMMSVAGVSLGVTVSVLGYCLLPMVGLAGATLLLSLQDIVGILLTVMAVVWCSLSASKLFVTALGMQKQQPLVAYPCALVYGVFALLAVF